MRLVPAGRSRSLAGVAGRALVGVAAVALTAALLMALWGLGDESGLDREQGKMQARQCISVLERRMRVDRGTGELHLQLGSQTYNFPDEAAFTSIFTTAWANEQLDPKATEALSRVRASALSDLCEGLVRTDFTRRSTASRAPDGSDQ